MSACRTAQRRRTYALPLPVVFTALDALDLLVMQEKAEHRGGVGAGEVPRVCAWPQLHGVHGVQGNMRGLGEDLCGLFLGSKFRHVGPQALHTVNYLSNTVLYSS